MFGLDITILAFAGLAAFGVGGILFVFLFDNVDSETRQAKRLKRATKPDPEKLRKANERVSEAAKRRQSIQQTLEEMEQTQQKKQKNEAKISLRKLIQQSGLSITISQFYFFSVLFGIFCTIVSLIGGANLFIVVGVFLAGTLGLPRWFVIFKRKRRFKAFLQEFPNAVDVVVRGVKAGLPLHDCLMLITRESKEPVRSEFAKVMETQKMGVPMSEAVGKLYQNVPLTETNFFAIVIAIQQSAGGNLSEALGNLSAVLRDRKKLEGKIKAMSAEAKASAGIIGSLPLVVMFLVYLTTPDYIMVLFHHPTGNLILLASAVWMSLGIMVMKNMINFDY